MEKYQKGGVLGFEEAAPNEISTFRFREQNYKILDIIRDGTAEHSFEIRPVEPVTREIIPEVTEHLAVIRLVLNQRHLNAQRGDSHSDNPHAMFLRVSQSPARYLNDEKLLKDINDAIGSIHNPEKNKFLHPKLISKEEVYLQLAAIAREEDMRILREPSYSELIGNLRDALIQAGYSQQRSIQGHSPNVVDGAINLFEKGDGLFLRDNLLRDQSEIQNDPDDPRLPGFSRAIALIENTVRRLKDGPARLQAYNAEYAKRMAYDATQRINGSQEEISPDDIDMGTEIYLNPRSAHALTQQAQAPLCNNPAMKAYIDIRNAIRVDMRGFLNDLHQHEKLSKRAPESDNRGWAYDMKPGKNSTGSANVNVAKNLLERLKKGERTGPPASKPSRGME